MVNYKGLNKVLFGNQTQKTNAFGLPVFEPQSHSRGKSDRDSRRSFTRTQQNDIVDRQKNRCAKCNVELARSHTHFDHIKP